jgi:hypothetical protein
MTEKIKLADICENPIDQQIIDVVSGSLLDKKFIPQTVFVNEQAEACKTGDTCVSLSNDEFAKGIFGDIIGTERPVMVSFAGNPNDIKKTAWFGKPWIIDKTTLSRAHNNYISFATFKPDDEGKYRRQKKQFVALYAVMLDDIGTKVPLERISLDFSWMIETSKDNFQIGFILDKPLTDATEADHLLKAIIDAGLTDPGASGPCSRLGRLPVAINGKHKNDDGLVWSCVTKVWQPDRRYSIQQLTDCLQIEIKETSQHRRSQGKKAGPSSNQHQDDVHIPRTDENPVISALKNSGHYKVPLGDGKHDITCPWINEHTNQVDQGTAYFEPSESYPLGGFKCQHGHCADRR